MPKRILIVEDDPNISMSLSYVLGRSGYVTDLESDGAAAVSTARNVGPDLMLLDLMLPGRNGYEVLDALRSAPDLKDLPVIMLTAKGRPEDRDAAIAHGANGFLTKPFANADLISAVEDQIGA